MRFMLQHYSPSVWAKRLGRISLDVVQLGTELPLQLRRIMREIERSNSG